MKNKKITLNEVLGLIAIIIILMPILFTLYKENFAKKDHDILNEKEERVSYSGSDYNVLNVYKDKCLNQEYCTIDDGLYIKYGDYTFAVFKRYSDEEVLAILVSDGFLAHILNDYSCTNNMCSYKYAKLTSSVSGLRDVVDTFITYLPNSNEVLNQINYDTGYIDLNNKYTKDNSFLSSVSFLNWYDYEILKDCDYFKNINTLLSTVRYASPLITESVDHYYSAGDSGRLSGIYVNNGNATIVSPLNRDNFIARPIIAIKSQIPIKSGDGTKDNPYILNEGV